MDALYYPYLPSKWKILCVSQQINTNILSLEKVCSFGCQLLAAVIHISGLSRSTSRFPLLSVAGRTGLSPGLCFVGPCCFFPKAKEVELAGLVTVNAFSLWSEICLWTSPSGLLIRGSVLLFYIMDLQQFVSSLDGSQGWIIFLLHVSSV